MLCFYYPINLHVKNGNVDEEYMELLTTYYDCMLSKFKDNAKEAADLRLGFQEILEEGFEYSEDARFQKPTDEDGIEQFYTATANDHVVYDLDGYILYARQRMIQCSGCWKTLETSKDKLPEGFFATALVDLRDRGGLRWATPDFYLTIIPLLKKTLDDHLESAEGYVQFNSTPKQVYYVPQRSNFSFINDSDEKVGFHYYNYILNSQLIFCTGLTTRSV